MSQMTRDGTAEDTSVVEQAQEKIQHGSEGRAKGAVREQLIGQIEERSNNIGAQLQDVAEAFRRTGRGLASEGNDGPARLVDGVSDRAERLGSIPLPGQLRPHPPRRRALRPAQSVACDHGRGRPRHRRFTAPQGFEPSPLRGSPGPGLQLTRRREPVERAARSTNAAAVKSNGNGLKSRKIGELVGVLAEDSKTLLRKEVELAKAELNERVEDPADRPRTRRGRRARRARAERHHRGLGRGCIRDRGGLRPGRTRARGSDAHASSRPCNVPGGCAWPVAFAIFALVAGAFALVGRKRLQRATPAEAVDGRVDQGRRRTCRRRKPRRTNR